jgi:hypothetical protein
MQIEKSRGWSFEITSRRTLPYILATTSESYICADFSIGPATVRSILVMISMLRMKRDGMRAACSTDAKTR